MADDIETVDELDTTGTVDDVTTADLEELEDVDDGGDADADKPTENKWNARRSLSELLEEDDAKKAAPATRSAGKPAAAPAKPAAAAAELDDEDDLDDEEDGDGKPKPNADQAKPKPAAPPNKARYAVKAADGKAFEFELQPGTSIQFKGDGKDVEVKSMDELVQLAQKGAAFDRKTTEQGQAIATLETTRTTLQEQLATVRHTAEETLLAALFDEEKAEELREALKPYLDPEYRRGQEALAREQERESKTKESTTQEIEGKRTEFWQGVGADITTSLPKFEHLEATDGMEIATRFHAGYVRAYEAKVAELTAAGTPEAKASQLANAHAFHFLTEKNLRRVMRGLNAELADERKGKKPAPGGKVDEKGAKAAAAAHNTKLDRTLERRARTPRLAGGGAVPGGGSGGASRTAAPAKARTFAQRMDNAFSLLRPDGEQDT